MVKQLFEKFDEEGDGFTIDILENGDLRVSYFINYHFRDEIIIKKDMLCVI